MRYVERNPVRAEMVQKAEEYRWSSAREHVKGSSDGLVSQGDEAFLQELEARFGRRLKALSPGRLRRKIMGAVP